MTFNVQHCLNFIKRKIDFPLFSQVLAGSGADIVSLNEVRGKGVSKYYEDQTRILAESAGYKYYYFAKAKDFNGCNPYGNAVLSKFPIISAQTVMIPDPKKKCLFRLFETRCIAKLTVDADGPLNVMSVHFGLNRGEQESAADTVCSEITESRCVLMGDFNVLPASKILIPVREKMRDTAEGRENMFTFPSNSPKMKIDYIFVSKDINVISSDIPEIVASDHRPHTADIEI